MGWPLVPLQPFSIAGWTWTNQGTATVTENAKSVFLTLPTGGGENRRSLTKALPAGTPTVTLGVVPHLQNLTSCGVGITLLESATGKLVNYMSLAFVGGRAVSGWRATGSTAAGTNYGNTDYWPPDLTFFQVRISATEYTVAYSFDGLNFIDVVTENKNAFFTTAPDRIGLIGFNNTAQIVRASFVHWSEA